MHIHETKWIGLNMDHKLKFTCMHELKVETHVWCYDGSAMAMMLWCYDVSVWNLGSVWYGYDVKKLRITIVLKSWW